MAPSGSIRELVLLSDDVELIILVLVLIKLLFEARVVNCCMCGPSNVVEDTPEDDEDEEADEDDDNLN